MGESNPHESATATQRILLVEDNPSDLRLLEEAFEEADSDATLQTTTNGDDAIEILREVQRRDPSGLPDLVLTDLNLPGRDGQAVIEAIRTELELPNLPVIVLTQSEDSDDVQRCYEAQANAFLTKPARFDDLVSLVGAIESFWFTLAERRTQPERQTEAVR